MINVIGIGQNRENMTLGAVRAIEESDVIVGYKKYVAQISDLVSDKEIIKKGMGDEIARAQLAIDKSLSGQTVSLISSGDPGVFGMANVLYQIISRYDEDIDGTVWREVNFPNIRYFMDGHAYLIDGHPTLVIGGAYSIDKWYRLNRATPGASWTGWFKDEQLTPEEMQDESEKDESLLLIS